MITSLFTLVGVLIVLALLIYGVQEFGPGPTPLKNIICALLVLIAVLWILGAIGFVRFDRVHI